jgi:hypothetical protein
MQYGRQKAVVGAAKHNAINTAFQQGFKAPADIACQRRIIELEHLDMGRPTGTGFDMHLDVGGMVANQLVQAGTLRCALRCQYGNASALGGLCSRLDARFDADHRNARMRRTQGLDGGRAGLVHRGALSNRPPP